MVVRGRVRGFWLCSRLPQHTSNGLVVLYAVSLTLQEDRVISDLEPVDLLTEHLGDKEAKEASGIDNAYPTSSGFMGDGDEAQVFKQAVQHSKSDHMQSVKDEL